MAQLLSSCFFTLPLLTPFTGARDPIFWAARRRPLPQGTLRREHRLSSYLGEKLHLGDIITIRPQAVARILEQEAAPGSFVIEKARCPSLLKERGFDLNSATCCSLSWQRACTSTSFVIVSQMFQGFMVPHLRE